MKINEVSSQYTINDIIAQCQQYIEQKPKHEELWRGFRSAPEVDIFKKTMRDDRKPSKTPPFVHLLANEFLSTRCGYKFRNGVFASGDYTEAIAYTHHKRPAYAIYPIGDFEFCWSPYIKDLTLDIKWSDVLAGKTTNEIKRAVFQILEQADFRNTDLAAAIESGNEVMLWAYEYFAISKDELPYLYMAIEQG